MKILFGLAVSLVVASVGFAAPITFSFTGKGSGTVGGTQFSNTAFTITALSDTNSRTTDLPMTIHEMDHVAAQIDLNGIGIYSFVTPTRTTVQYVHGYVTFGRAIVDGLVLASPANIASLKGWDMRSPVGPITPGFILGFWEVPQILTSGGTLVFLDAVTLDGTFTASLIPEPSAFAVAAIGLIAVAARRHIRS